MTGDEEGKRTETSSFGVSSREGHDSSRFYGARLYEGVRRPAEGVDYFENEVPPPVLDTVRIEDARDMSALPDASVHLMVTSPPYNVTKEYDEDLTLKEYLDLLGAVFSETMRVLVPGGRAAINIANVGRKPYLPLHLFAAQLMLELGFHMRGEIIWDKGASAGTSCAWGSFASASNPCLRDVHEYILVFSKEAGRLEKGGKADTVTSEHFTEWTKSVWRFQAASARRVGHPAPFPEELPRRLIELYTFAGDVVLDPFMGSGTTGLAAKRVGRHFVGFETSEEYARLARGRIAEFTSQRRMDDYFSPAEPTIDDFLG
jgi:modification methylase